MTTCPVVTIEEDIFSYVVSPDGHDSEWFYFEDFPSPASALRAAEVYAGQMADQMGAHVHWRR